MRRWNNNSSIGMYTYVQHPLSTLERREKLSNSADIDELASFFSFSDCTRLASATRTDTSQEEEDPQQSPKVRRRLGKMTNEGGDCEEWRSGNGMLLLPLLNGYFFKEKYSGILTTYFKK